MCLSVDFIHIYPAWDSLGLSLRKDASFNSGNLITYVLLFPLIFSTLILSSRPLYFFYIFHLLTILILLILVISLIHLLIHYSLLLCLIHCLSCLLLFKLQLYFSSQKLYLVPF